MYRRNPTDRRQDPSLELEEYLNTPHLVYDERLIRAFIKAEGIPFPKDADGDRLSDYALEAWAEETQTEAYAEWFASWGAEIAEAKGVEVELPTFYRNARSAAGWFLHFTASRFTSFEDGVPRDFLGESRTTGKEVTRRISCPANLHADPEKALWIHAWEVFQDGSYLNRDMVLQGGQYGSNALLFQSDAAVVAEHTSHEQEHALVLGCSEYNAVQLLNVERNTLEEDYKDTLKGIALLKDSEELREVLEEYEYLAQDPNNPDEILFEDIEQLIELLDSVRMRQNPRSFWHPLALED